MSGPAARIVVGIDGSESALNAVLWAARECLRQDGVLRLVFAFHLPDWGLPELDGTVAEVRASLRRHAADCLAEAAEVARTVSAEVPVEQRVREQSAAAALIEESGRARLLVVGSRGLGGFAGLLLGSTALALSTHARSPVVVVRGCVPEHGRVVVGADGSLPGERAIGFAFAAAARRGAPVVAVLAWADAVLDQDPMPADWTGLAEEHHALLGQRLTDWTERYPEVRVQRVVVRDRPVRALLRAAADAQLLVVGARGLGGFAGLLLGSTSRSLLLHAPCPTVVLRPAEPG
ncbi:MULTISPECIES: universal stress protein [unclassified Crossiella]|uniref:universal stress protein n=1 Tax=unclassified Crossiella TaxID=2620835 RepID=UPI00200008B8|nr:MULTISPECIES: universal stress protein [unclassified Crossiella]MCK2241710.1 universal stress protein [Crossiella sp. S99.2]MCK2255418.1 universal stress protein [Crossiella sp. S99.1]